MQKQGFVFSLLFVIIFPFYAHAFPHLDLEATGEEYLELQKNSPVLGDPVLNPILAVGVRNLEWLRYINSFRDEAHKLSFTSAATQTGIPIDQPLQYSPQIIVDRYNQTLTTVPQDMKRVLLQGEAYTQNPPMDDSTYIAVGLQIDRIYQLAARWNMMLPWLTYLEGRSKLDVRGYYFLSREPDLQTKLNNWQTLPTTDKNRLQPLLLGICINSAEVSRCTTELNTAIANNTVMAFYNRYISYAQATYDDFFSLYVKRDDSLWTTQPPVLYVPFRRSSNADVMSFLVNIEDEWKWNGWQLKLDFRNSGSIPYVEFKPGVTPNVEFIGGNKITMDANQPLTEYNVRWTIRHEFGHVLGFPDCYLEFYNRAEGVITSYQLDIENIMCSRKGKLQELHYLKLRQAFTGQ